MNNWKGKYGPLLIAEIGGNHEGDFEYAKRLVKLAIDTDVDYVKLQIYSGETLVNGKIDPGRVSHFNKFKLTLDQYKELAKMCIDSNIGFLASVWSKDLIELFDNYLDFYKIGSGDLTSYPILKILADKGKPIIMSTGLSNMKEILASIDFIKSINPIYNKENLAILQCTSMYPIAHEEAQLNNMLKIKEITGLSIGYSDHTIDSKALLHAYVLGAQILEFHFTDTKENKTFRDHQVSLTQADVANLIEEIELFNKLFGTKDKDKLACELESGHHISFRRAVYLNKNLKSNSVISENDLVVLRPNIGIGAEYYFNLVGKTLTVDVEAFDPLSFDFFK